MVKMQLTIVNKKIGGVAHLARASVLHTEGSRFDPYHLHILSYGVIGNTSVFGTEESRFEPLWDN